MKLLVVDDDPVCADLLSSVLGDLGYEVEVASTGAEAYEMTLQSDIRVVLTDWQMPEMSGVELCRRIRQRALSSYVYVILVTSLTGRENLIEGFAAGADDYITKPFDVTEMQMRIRTAERIVSLESRDLLIFSLAKLAESRDPETGAHLERVREYCRILATELSQTPKHRSEVGPDYIRTLYLTSPLHDIGKVGIPDSVLLKPGRLTAEEFEIMKQHTLIGCQTLEATLQCQPNAEFLRFARDVAWTHHERYDGSGYPRRLKGDEIPLCGRIMAVADVYDALTTKRVYKPRFDHRVARSILVDGAGASFDPDVIQAFIRREDEFLRIRDRLGGNEAAAEESALGLAAKKEPESCLAAR